MANQWRDDDRAGRLVTCFLARRLDERTALLVLGGRAGRTTRSTNLKIRMHAPIDKVPKMAVPGFPASNADVTVCIPTSDKIVTDSVPDPNLLNICPLIVSTEDEGGFGRRAKFFRLTAKLAAANSNS